MSRIGKKPVAVPAGVKVEVAGATVNVEGPKGKLSLELPQVIKIRQESDVVVCERADEERQSRALHGLFRSLIQNMVDGVSKGFEKSLRSSASVLAPHPMASS